MSVTSYLTAPPRNYILTDTNYLSSVKIKCSFPVQLQGHYQTLLQKMFRRDSLVTLDYPQVQIIQPVAPVGTKSRRYSILRFYEKLQQLYDSSVSLLYPCPTFIPNVVLHHAVAL